MNDDVFIISAENRIETLRSAQHNAKDAYEKLSDKSTHYAFEIYYLERMNRKLATVAEAMLNAYREAEKREFPL